MAANRQTTSRRWLSWLAAFALFALCGILGTLQYRWIGEVSVAERDRLQTSLRDTLSGVSLEFNSEIAAACRALLPADTGSSGPDQVAARYARWRSTSAHARMFTRVGMVTPVRETLALQIFEPLDNRFHSVPWPLEWREIQQRIAFNAFPAARNHRPFPSFPTNDEPVFDIPLLTTGSPPSFGAAGPQWLLYELNVPYATAVLLPELLNRHLGSSASDYQIEVLSRSEKPSVIYRSGPAHSATASADAAVGLFEPRFDLIFPEMVSPSQRQQRQPGSGPGSGRWQLLVWHRQGSLEALVAITRRRNLAVTAGVLLLMLASVAALIQFTRRAQRLAGIQMDFVAGVSHELRTPLTVIHTAAWNLRRGVASSPAQVQHYGQLIQRESERLKEMVEQVLRFVGTSAAGGVRVCEPVSIPAVVQDALAASKAAIEAGHFTVEQHMEPELPMVSGDSTALKHAIQNLLANAVKYGVNGVNWIGISASTFQEKHSLHVELRIADHGPGIPPDEQSLIFEPFFRGRRAINEQVHGTGLGLNLVQKIMQAHGGSVRVKSSAAHGTEFIMRIPAVNKRATGDDSV